MDTLVTLSGMVMADRPEVQTASAPVTALTVVGLAQSMINGLARVPFRKPWSGPSGLLDNLGQSVTRQTIRAFMGYSMGLPIEEFRSMEKILDDVCRVVMPPFVELTDGVELTDDIVGGVPGLWCRAKASSDAYVDDDEDKEEIGATILYLHGGGYIGTSPMMYSAFASSLVRISGHEVFIADYRMAPESPSPQGFTTPPTSTADFSDAASTQSTSSSPATPAAVVSRRRWWPTFGTTTCRDRERSRCSPPRSTSISTTRR